jgi:glycerol uptake facilitator protein
LTNTITKKEFFGELIGTAIILIFGNGVVASSLLFGLGDFFSINIAWGLAVLFGILVSSKLSGAHLNPAVTFALLLRRNFPLSKLFPYILAQILGAFIGSLLVYLNYFEKIFNYETEFLILRGTVSSIKTASIFTTFPSPSISNLSAFFDQVFGTFLLVLLIFTCTDEKNQILNLGPILVSLVVVVIGMSFGASAGYPINPARDFGPRLMTSLFGWGKIVFNFREFYFYIPILAPIIGGIFGAYFYDFCIRKYLD